MNLTSAECKPPSPLLNANPQLCQLRTSVTSAECNFSALPIVNLPHLCWVQFTTADSNSPSPLLNANPPPYRWWEQLTFADCKPPTFQKFHFKGW